MSRVKGKPLSPEEKHFIVTIKGYFDRNKSEFGLEETSVQLVSEALGIGLATVNRTMAAYKKDPKSIHAPLQPRGRPTHAVDASFQEIVRSYIRSANLEGIHISAWLKNHPF